MIATRFRAVRLAAGISAAALGCYLVSLQVAAERGHLMKMERNILSARADIRQLRTELDTRGRLVQLERWNAQVLGLQAPKVEQYAADAVQLAAYAPGRIVPAQVLQASMTAPRPAAPAQVQTVSVRATPAPQPQPRTPPAATPLKPDVQTATFKPVHVSPPPSLIHRASYSAPIPVIVAPAPRPAKPKKPASLLPDDLMTAIDRAAAAEKRGK